MYDPSSGRWLIEDPIGFDAGDVNLYRYVGNNPTNAIDPTGLAPKQLNLSLPGFTGAEMAALIADMHLAVKRLDKALSMLTDHWDELEALSTTTLPGGKKFVSRRYRTLASEYKYGDDVWGVYTSTYKEYYTRKIKQVLDPLNDTDHCTAFNPDRSPPTPNGRRAYVIYYFGVFPGSTINITNLFFTRSQSEQIDVIVHELARRIGFGQENTGDLLWDVYEWDQTIDFLVQKYDELMSKKK